MRVIKIDNKVYSKRQPSFEAVNFTRISTPAIELLHDHGGDSLLRFLEKKATKFEEIKIDDKDINCEIDAIEHESAATGKGMLLRIFASSDGVGGEPASLTVPGSYMFKNGLFKDFVSAVRVAAKNIKKNPEYQAKKRAESIGNFNVRLDDILNRRSTTSPERTIGLDDPPGGQV